MPRLASTSSPIAGPPSRRSATLSPLTTRLARATAPTALLAALLVTPLATAADDASAAPPPKAPAKGTDDLLRGPRVSEGDSRDDRAFGRAGQRQGPGGEAAGRRPLMQHRLWMETMRAAELSPEQREKVDAIMARFQSERQAFEKEHREAREALEKRISEHGPDTAEGRQVRQEMRNLAEKAPKPEAFQAEAFAVLTSAQQESFRKSLAEREARLQARQGNRQRSMEGQDGEAPGRGQAGGRPAAGDGAARGQRPRAGGAAGTGGAGGAGERGESDRPRGRGGAGRAGGEPAKDGSSKDSEQKGKAPPSKDDNSMD